MTNLCVHTPFLFLLLCAEILVLKKKMHADNLYKEVQKKIYVLLENQEKEGVHATTTKLKTKKFKLKKGRGSTFIKIYISDFLHNYRKPRISTLKK